MWTGFDDRIRGIASMGEDLVGEEDRSLRTSVVVTTDKESKVRSECRQSVKDEDEAARDE